MINTGKLAGKTIFITGASRGIGKTIALKAARDGANVVIAAKTAEAHPKLPGTIYSAAKEVEDAGGRCLPFVVDVRSEEQVRSAVESAVKRFGGIDILINNASAISLTGTLDTPMKKYDLMNGVNARGTFLCSQAAIPYLKQSSNPHILNISPPLNMDPKWFHNHVAYTQAKYGMSMCVLGMAGEFKKDGIAVNALWPRTAIWTAAMDMLTGSDSASTCRKPDIMADAAYVMLTRDARNYTGNFAIDEEVLRSVGVENFEHYSCVPGSQLMLDFFLEEASPDAAKFVPLSKTVKAGCSSNASGASTPASAPAADAQLTGVFEALKSMVNEDMVKSIGGVFNFNLKDAGLWHVDLKTGSGRVGSGPASVPANCTMSLSADNFVMMFTGKLNPANAFMSGKLKIEGDMMLAMKLEKLIKQMVKSKL